jgi:hypothetical protein
MNKQHPDRDGLDIVAMRQLPRGFFFENARIFVFKNFVRTSILFEGIFREIEAFLVM